MAKAAAEQALALAPESPQVHRAVAYYYYYAYKDYEKALEEFNIAEIGLPNNARILDGSGYVLSRDLSDSSSPSCLPPLGKHVQNRSVLVGAVHRTLTINLPIVTPFPWYSASICISLM